MSAGRGASRRALLVGAPLTALAALSRRAGADATALAPSVVLARFRDLPGLEARFREEKRVSLLAAPLVSEGTLHFQPPARVVRHTLTPRRGSVLVDGRSVTLWDGKKVERIDAGASPVAAAFIESFGQLLAGDQAGLERAFRLRAAAQGEAWTLHLEPRGGNLARALREMRARGEGRVLTSLEVDEPSGDGTVMRFASVDTARRYSAEEAARIFRVPT